MWSWFFFSHQVRPEDVGTYECVVVNKGGKATCSARLTVDKQVQMQPKPAAPSASQAPKLIEPMRDQHVDEGNPATFFCQIQGTPEPVIQWYYNNQAIKPSKYFRMTSQNGVHTLYITGAFPEDQGVYRCQALNQAGEVTCIAHLKVNGKWVKVTNFISMWQIFVVDLWIYTSAIVIKDLYIYIYFPKIL